MEYSQDVQKDGRVRDCTRRGHGIKCVCVLRKKG